MEREELAGLIEKYLDGTATAEERQALLTWYRNIDHSRIEIPLEPSLEKEEIRKRMYYRLEQYITRKRPARKITWYRWAAAAALLLIIGGGYFWIYAQRIKNQGIASSAVKNDLSPGGNRAVLTLANGEKIILDNVHNGQLATQGNSKVMKVDSGLLAYNAQLLNHSTNIQYNTLTTPRGGQYQVILPDGSKVWLNAASSITYPTAFMDKERKVRVTGEVYFEVVHDANKPFKVKAGEQEIEVLGTSFNVNTYPDEPFMKTALVTGAVKISGVTLKPGQQNCIDKQTGKTTIKEINTDDVIAWVHGQLPLEGDDLPTLMRTISRWYDVDVRFEGNVPQCNLIGRIDRGIYLSNLLNALSLYGIHTSVKGRTIIVLGE